MANTRTPAEATQKTELIPPTGSMLPFNRDWISVQDTGDRVLSLGSKYVNCHPVKFKQFGRNPEYQVKSRLPGRVASTTAVVQACHVSNIGVAARYFYTEGFVLRRRGTLDSNVVDPIVDISWNLPTPNTAAITTYLTAAGVPMCAVLQQLGSVARISYINLNTNIMTGVDVGTITLPSNPSIVFMDGYLFLCDNNQRIYNSNPGSPDAWTPANNFIDAEMVGDSLVALDVHHNNIVAFGNSSIEFFYNAANQIASPLSRNASYAVRFGLFGVRWNKININDDIYFIAGSGGQAGSLKGIARLSKFQFTFDDDNYIAMLMDEYRFSPSSEPTIVAARQYGEDGIIVTLRGDIAAGKPGGWGSAYFSLFRTTSDPTWSVWTWSSSFIEVPIFSMVGQSTNRIFMQSLADYRIPIAALPGAQVGTYETVRASITTDIIDFNTEALKHWVYVGVRGNFTEPVRLEYITDTQQPFSSTLNTTYVDCSTRESNTTENPRRWRNLGKSRRRVFRITSLVSGGVNGHYPFTYEGLEVRYNQGPY